jgi:Protein of unknown function (DUF3822)
MAGKNNTNIHVYNKSEDPSLISQVSQAVCVFMQRGLMTAGFNAAGELLTIHYHGYNKNRQVWELDFFEQLFMQEPLATISKKIKGVFICTDKQLVVPDALYKEKEAKEWLKRIHFVDIKEVTSSYHFDAEQKHYLLAVPPYIAGLVKVNSKGAATLPMAAYQLRQVEQQGLFAQCCVMPDQVCITLHDNGNLLWHKVFGYRAAEDIAFELKHACRENKINDEQLHFVCNAVSAAEHPVVAELSRYFPGTKAGNGSDIDSKWQPAISLAQQLLACVS